MGHVGKREAERTMIRHRVYPLVQCRIKLSDDMLLPLLAHKSKQCL